MMIVFLILKVLGLIVLGLLALVLLLAGMALWVPIRYRVEGSVHEGKLLARVRVTWLLHFVRFTLDYDEHMRYSLRVLWFRLLTDDGTAAKTAADSDSKPSETAGSLEPSMSAAELRTDPEPVLDPARTAEETDAGADLDPATQDEETMAVKKPHRWRKPLSSIRNLWKNVRRKFYGIRQGKKKIERILSDERNQSAMRYLWKQLQKMLRRISPHRLFLKLQFSTGAPDTTGEVLGILAMFPMVYRNRWEITPDFVAEEFYVDGSWNIRGRLRTIHVLLPAGKVFVHRDCRRMYRMIRYAFSNSK